MARTRTPIGLPVVSEEPEVPLSTGHSTGQLKQPLPLVSRDRLAEPIDPQALAELQRSYLQSLPLIEGHAHKRFHYLHGDERDDAVAETVALAWKAYRHLFLQGRDIEDIRGAIAVFAGKTVASGGRLVGQHPVNDVMSPTFRRGHSLGEPREQEWIQETSPAEQAVYNADLQEWLSGLGERHRAVAEQLLSGLNTVEVAESHGVTRTMIWHIRQDLLASWQAFHSE